MLNLFLKYFLVELGCVFFRLNVCDRNFLDVLEGREEDGMDIGVNEVGDLIGVMDLVFDFMELDWNCLMGGFCLGIFIGICLVFFRLILSFFFFCGVIEYKLCFVIMFIFGWKWGCFFFVYLNLFLKFFVDILDDIFDV